MNSKILTIPALALCGLLATMCSTKEEYYPKGTVFPPGATLDEKVDIASRVVPDARQLQWQDLELTAFLHFGVNTFTDREWGDGTEDPQIFNPQGLDARQWVKTLKDAGFKMVILTAKHHDGFCLWPTATTAHSVAASSWKEGQGDVVRELRQACDEYGMKLGLYLSPWDRNAEAYGDSPRYNDMFVAQLTELLTNYGKIDEVWFDGACAEGPNGKKQEYDWERFRSTIQELQPEAVMAIMGDDVRWVGNEGGVGRETEWSVTALAPGILHEATAHNDSLRINNLSPDLGSRELLEKSDRVYWWPSEVDVSIRPGWFYHASENPKSLRDLANIYLTSVGRNAVLLLNIPPNRQGRIESTDSIRLMELRRWIDTNFSDNLIDDKGMAVGNAPVEVNCIVLEEDIAKGQRVEKFTVNAKDADGKPVKLTEGTTIGKKRILTFPTTRVSAISVDVDQYRGRDFHVKPLKAYKIELPEHIVESESGFETIKPSRMKTVDPSMTALIDGDNTTVYEGSSKDIVIDLGKPVGVAGFTYVPRQDGSTDGMIYKYAFAVSQDGKTWTECDLPGEFSNIMHNPIPQNVYLPIISEARYIKLSNLEPVKGNTTSGAEIRVKVRAQG